MTYNTPGQNQSAVNAVPWTNGKGLVTGATIATLLTGIIGSFYLYAPLSGATFTGPVSAPNVSTAAFHDVSAVDLNVVCDGATDVGAAINTALSTYAGYTVRLPESASDCMTSVSIIVPANTIFLGSGATVINGALGKPGMGPVVKLNGNGAQVRDMKIKGSGAGTTLAGGISAGATSLTVASATGWPTVGPFKATIFADGANSTETVNVSSVSGTTWTIAATSGAHGNNALVQSPRLDDGVYVGLNLLHNSIFNVEVSGAGDNGIETDGSDTKISFNYVHNNFTNGIYHIGNSGTHAIMYGAIISNNRTEHNSVFSTTCTITASTYCWDGIDLDPLTANDIVSDNYVQDNDIIAGETEAAWSTTSSGHLIIGNNVVNSVAGCLTTAGFEDNIKFIGNHCVNVLAGSAITVHGPTTNFQIENNTVEGSTGPCMLVYSSAAPFGPGVADSGVISNNVCTNTVSAGGGYSSIQIQDSATNIQVQMNKVAGTNGGLYAINTSAAAASISLTQNGPLTMGSTAVASIGATQPLLGQPGVGSGSLLGGIGTGSTIGSAGVYSFAWGQGPTASAASSQALGYVVIADSTFASAMGGNAWTQSRYGAHCYASGDFAANGDSQYCVSTLRGKGITSSGTVTIRATADGNAAASSNCLNLTSNTKYMNTSHLLTIVDSTTAARVSFTLTGAGIYRGANAAATAIDGTTFPVWLRGSNNGSSTGGTAALVWNAPTMTADTTNGCMNISWVSPSETADTFYVVDTVQTTEH